MAMKSDRGAIEALESLINRCQRPGQAAAAAYRLHLLSELGTANQPRVRAARQRLMELLERRGWRDIADRQLAYALRLAESDGDLVYEEMHKLFSLCDEVHALRSLGLSLDETSWEKFEEAARDRFARQRRMASLVAEDRAELWKAKRWWYAENRG